MEKEYDLFISHKQDNAGELALNIKNELLKKNKNLKVFLDVDDLNNIHDLERNIKNSKNILLLITKGVFEREFVIKEIRSALRNKKKIITIWDKRHLPIFPKKNQIPSDISCILNIRAITWASEIYFRNAIMDEILGLMVFEDKSLNNEKLLNKSKLSKKYYFGVLDNQLVFEITLTKNNYFTIYWICTKESENKLINKINYFEINNEKIYEKNGIIMIPKEKKIKNIEINNFCLSITNKLGFTKFNKYIKGNFKLFNIGNIKWLEKDEEISIINYKIYKKIYDTRPFLSNLK